MWHSNADTMRRCWRGAESKRILYQDPNCNQLHAMFAAALDLALCRVTFLLTVYTRCTVQR